MPRIYILDVTNRDGVQTAKLGLSKIEKTLLNIYLNKLGVFQSEFGFPTTKHETLYLQANLELAEMGSSIFGVRNLYLVAGQMEETAAKAEMLFW